MKTFIYSVAIAIMAFAALTLAFPQDEDMATEGANLDEAYESGLLDSFTFTHVELMEEDSDLEDRAEDADDSGLVMGQVGYAAAAVVKPCQASDNHNSSDNLLKATQVAINDIARTITGKKRKDRI
eukprot:snap_masked-scaffold1306_size49381-processed-gene-0.4 protein:Tk10696 transcript:snap_masked-scaffold1306_size49381-processed-gene-0.4-mRNA-1 annotation:"putative uncharacterized protein"